MEIIPEVARNSGTLICRKDRATLCCFSQNLISSSEHFYNIEHSGIRDLPSSLCQGVQATILDPGDARPGKSLGSFARYDHPGPCTDIHIRGQPLELLVQI